MKQNDAEIAPCKLIYSFQWQKMPTVPLFQAVSNIEKPFRFAMPVVLNFPI